MRKISKFSRKLLDISMARYIGGFVLVVILFGIAYTLLTPCGHGIGQTLDPPSDITFLTGIYFSIVTISSLGYGDMHPMGFSKILACIEVLLGLAAIGIMIAKVTSRRLENRVSHLFSSDVQKQLEDISKNLDTSQHALSRIMPQFATAYQDTPGEAPIDENVELLIENFRGIIRDFQSACSILRDHFSEGIDLDDYFQNVPVSSVRRVGNAVKDAFSILSELLTSLPSQARNEILDRSNRQSIAEAIDSQIRVCKLVNQYAIDQDSLNVFQRIKETCEQIAGYVAVPEEPQLSQVLQDIDEPQESSEMDN